jgi:Xaa-Pro aminopeptidase
MRSATEKRIEEGDMLCIEITPADKPYSIQFVTTLVVGDVSKERMEKADYLIEGIREAEAAIKPGTPLSEMAKILNDSIARAGCWEFCRPPFTLDHRGHGQSINITEYNDMKMEKGMEFVVHPIQYFPDVGGMMFGDHVLVTDKGYERMFQTELKLFSIPRGGL